jgi:aspartyl-tRNA(Asn)/glutamyl-tRNA(Gln) amidotransferase subunit C
MLAFAMPTALTRDDVAAIAALAHLELDGTELDLFARQLGNILEYANQVQQVDTTGVPPTASVVAGHSADRPDVVAPSLDISDTLANAPDADRTRLEGGFFKVPRVIG